MSKSASATIAVTVIGDGLNLSDSDTIVNPSGIAPTSVTLVAGPNDVQVPASAKGVKIVPPAGNTVGLLLGTHDGGVVIDPGSPSYLSLPPSAGVFSMASAATVTVLFIWV